MEKKGKLLREAVAATADARRLIANDLEPFIHGISKFVDQSCRNMECIGKKSKRPGELASRDGTESAQDIQ